ncbi:bifunctional PIG-L family deacetylase/class I SAM-dependent methyltransferase [Lysinibacter cavernae]|uniref:LmbE family N-acetylglucosaminyl deacetylase/protein-L-isoaspartate O-methyltransferase n=1 Tax=Lysinibacter cavernae TaxID=1640652 RepID=A0A7X5TSB6_9MICO|nr:bifunctional PIG-L family deacetylase/class I SAM-dependent methyltransferase [Lysinibacter cavernae]NIH53331.1 LmbE family N-acetylglucosaminyl deacetylase/protein-L-isoaspartate O-methyltransferase [Lysinibacter cavernae]
MVAFSHRDPGTSEAEWMRAPLWNELPEITLDGVTRLVVIAAHPDDETLGAAGLIARAAQQGIAITLVMATDGEASHPESPTHTPAELGDWRRREVLAALALVAPEARVVFAGLPDGRMGEGRGETLAEHPLAQQLAETLRAELTEVTERGSALLLSPWRGDGHRDHRVVAAVAEHVAEQEGIRLLEYPIWLWHWAEPSDPAVPWRRMFRMRLDSRERHAKREALNQHVSQTRPLSDLPGDEVMIGRHIQEHFERDFEILIEPQRASERSASLGHEFFDNFYRGKSDPWGFQTRWYERRKRDLTMAALPRERYTSTLEIGCATGILTARLAERSNELLAVDAASAACERAAERLTSLPHATVQRLSIPAEWPEGDWDLIVLSEVAYYWSAEDVTAVLDRAVSALRPGGTLLACHWRHLVPEYPLTGDQVHHIIRRRLDLNRVVSHIEHDLLLEVFVVGDPISVAAAEGLIRP